MQIRTWQLVRCLRKTDCVLAVHAAIRRVWPLLLSLLFVAPSFGQTLTQVEVSPSDSVAGNGTVYTVSFITSTSGVGLPNNGKIRLTFPAAFGVSAVSLAAPVSPPNGITSGFTEPVVAGQVVTVTRDGNGAAVAAGDTAVFKMAVVVNPTAARQYALLVETLTNAGTLIDSAPSDSFRISVGPLFTVKVLTGANGNNAEVLANTLTADQTLSMHAGGFDNQGNYRGDVSVNWGVSGGIGSLSAATGVATIFSANKKGDGQITADYPTAGVIDGATGKITVVSGALAKVIVVAGLSGDGPALGTYSMTTDQSLPVHAAGYDSDNNYVQDEPVTWTVTNGIGVLSPGTGTATTLDAHVPGVGVINANHATLTDDATDFITVNLGAPHHIKILSGASGPTSEVNTSALTAGQTLPVHASSFDADDNYIGDLSVNWSVTGGIGSLSAAAGITTTFTAQKAGTGVINADHATLIDDVTGNITVSAGTLAKVKIVEGTSGDGAEMGAATFTTDNSPVVHAAGYDANDNYVGDQIVTWSVSGGVGTVFPSSGASTTLNLTTPGSGNIAATHASATGDVAGPVTVVVGSPYRVKILTGSNGNPGELTAQTLTAGATLLVHAGSFDADGNYTGDVPVNWSVSGNVGTLNPTSGNTTTLTATGPGNGAITADHASLIDGVSATITVTMGSLSYIKVVEGPAGHGTELDTKALTTDQPLTVHAAGYDAGGNYLGDFSVTWSVTFGGGANGSLSSTTGTATTFDPRKAGTATITATHATVTGDATGTITISNGAAHHVKVYSSASGNTSEVTTALLTAGQTLTVHASSFDADDNRLGDVSVNWVLSGGIGSLSPTSGISTVLTATAAGTGTITADHATLIDDATGTITVSAGALSFVKIVEGASGIGPEMGGKNLTTDNTLTVHAAGYDANGNYISDVSVNWSVSGGIGAVSPLTGTSTTLTLTTPGSGIITADHTVATDDVSGTISVGTGLAHHVKVIAGPSGTAAEVTTASLQVGNTLTVHAGSFDAHDNYIADVSVTWNVTGNIGSLSSTVNTTTTLTAQKAGTGAIIADHPTLIDDATDVITVTAASLAKVRIVEGESGNGPELVDKNATTDETITVHAAGYDAADNYLGDFPVNWSVTNNIGTFSVNTGPSTRLNLTTPGNGVITADHATAVDDQSGTITVTAGNPHHVKILSQANGNTSPVDALNLPTGANLAIHASSFDADENYIGDVSVSWSVTGGIGNVAPSAGTSTTFTATTAGTGVIIADHPTLTDDVTGTITVTVGTLSYVRIVEGASGNGPEVDTKNLTTDQILTVHAAGYDASGNYLSDFTVNWSVSNGIGTLTPTLGATATFDPRTPGTGVISADHPTPGVGDDVTGNITVTIGAKNRIKVLDNASGNTTEVGNVTLTAGQTLVVHAGSFDADGNFIGDEPVNWNVSGGIGTLSSLSGISTTLTATTAGTGVIVGDHATLIDDATGTITVSPASLRYIKIVEGSVGNGPELTTKSLNTDQTLTVHAAGYDGSGNYLGDEPVTWNVSGGIGILSPATGIATTLEANKPGTGIISADHATATDDVTGNITVIAGSAYRVKILSGAAGLTTEVDTATLLTGGTLIVHAGSYDRDDNYINDVAVDWNVSGGIGTLNPLSGISTTLTATTVGTGVITAVNNTLIGDATGTITVQASTLSYVKIVEGASGNGPELPDRNVTTDQTITVHAAGYDASGNYLGDQAVTWSITGNNIGTLSATSGISTTLDFKTPGTGQVLADHATATDDLSGVFTVDVGASHRVKVLDGAAGATAEVTTRTLTTGGTLTVHASSFDADNNRIADVTVDWRVSGGIGTLSPLNGVSTTLTATTPGTGVITADHPTLIDDATGDIVVNAGNLSYIKVVLGPAGNGAELGLTTLTTDQTLTVHAAGYDPSGVYLGDQAVAWSITGNNIGTLSNSTGLSTTLDAKKPGVGQIFADHATATDDATGNITVSVGAENRIKILSGLTGNTAEVRDTTLTTGQTLPVHASSFDADGNYFGDVAVSWTVTGQIGTLAPAAGISTTLTATKAGTGVINADHPTLLDDATGTISVTSGNLSYVKIIEGESGNGPELGSKSLTTDQTLTVHAAGYDAAGNYLGDQPVTWSVTGGIGTFSPTAGVSSIFDARAPGTGVITADHATATDDNSGTITVASGTPVRVKIMSGVSGNSTEVDAVTRSTGQTLVVHASSFDADDNYKQDESVTWTVTGGIGTLAPTTGASTTFTATKVGTGVITADHATLPDDNTGLITIVASNLSYIKIVEGTAGNGPEVTTRSLSTDQAITVHAAGYDANGNYLNDEPVTWAVTNNIGTLSSTTGLGTTLNPTRPGIGRIIADHATASDDTTGDLTISPGALSRVKVLAGANGIGGEVTGASLVAGQTFVVHAGGFDADDNYINDFPVNWSITGVNIGALVPVSGISTTLTAHKVGVGQIKADHATALDGLSGSITVTAGTLAFIKVIEGLTGNGAEIGPKTITTDNVLLLHAAGFDADSNYVGDVNANWSSIGGLAPLVSINNVTSITFAPALSGVSGVIRATHATAGFDNTGTITVNAGTLNKIKILSGPVGGSTEVGDITVSSGQTLIVHAGGFDAKDNYIADRVANWSVPSSIGTVNPASGTSTTFTAGTAGKGTIRAVDGTREDFTGEITVTTSSVAKIILRTAANNGGTSFGNSTITADDQVTVFAAGYDAGNNYLGDVSVSWSSTGNLTPAVSATGPSFIFSPTLANADGSVNGFIIGAYSPSIKDSTGTITVLPGAPRGNITLTPNPNALNADGNATSTINSGDIKDGDGNNVGANKLFTVALSPPFGTIDSPPDADPQPGYQIATNALSRLSFIFKAGTTGGIVTITVAGGSGASGSTQISLGSLSIESITTTPTAVSQGQSGITISMFVRNLSTAAVTNLTGQLNFIGSANRNAEYTVQAPVPATLAGSSTATLSFIVAVHNNATPEAVTINGSVQGTIGSTVVSAEGTTQTDSWTVQRAANLTIQTVASAADTVAQGQTNRTVTVHIANNLGFPNSAAANIDSVRLILKQGPVDVTSDYIISNPVGPTAIIGNSAGDYTFIVNVRAAAALGLVSIDAKAYGKDANSNQPISVLTADTKHNWTVVEGNAFRIASITPSQSKVTAGMTSATREWNVVMAVDNVGSSDINLDLDPAKTFIQFTIGSQNVTAEYTIDFPPGLDEGGTVLTGRTTGHLTFRITRTGTTRGIATISGFAEGLDIPTSQTVKDNTNDGGTGEVTVQAPAIFKIEQLLLSQSTVTQNMDKDWRVKAVVKNDGEADLRLHPSPDSLKISVGNSAGYTFSKPSAFATGDSILSQGETDSLFVVVTKTGSALGNQTVSLSLKGIEQNRLQLLNSNPAAATVTVQSPATLHVKTVQLKDAPNLPFVNVSDSITAAVTIENTGQEAADTVRIHLATDGFSTITQAERDIPTIPGRTTRTVNFDITTSSSENPAGEIFRASITAGKARNTGANIIPASPEDDTARAIIQRPAVFQITRVLTSETKVEAGRALPWYIYAVVTNNGGAAIVLNKPNRDDVTVQIDGVIQNDYSIQPDTLLRRNRTLQLAAGEIDTVRYTVLFTGVQRGGQASLLVKLTGRDKNTNAPLSDDEAGQIEVTTTATVQILTASPLVIRKVGDLGYVNVNQTFDVEVAVQNISPFENVKEVRVRLVSDLGRSTISTAEQVIDSIKTRESGTVTFTVQADTTIPSGAQNETFTASITSALTPGGQPATIRQGVGDSTAQVLVQRPARLSVAATISEPTGTLSSNQLFDFTASITNSGQSTVNDSGEVTLNLPAGFTIEQPGSNAFTRRFTVGVPVVPVVWKLRAPNQGLTNVDLRAVISAPSKDLNINAPAALGKSVDTVTVTVVPTDLKINSVAITSPEGAKDRTVSTDQTFRLTAQITHSPDLNNATAELQLRAPQQYRLVNFPAIQALQPLQDIVIWDVQAPSDAFEIPTYLVVRARGVDRSGVPIERLDSLNVVTVEKADLNLTARIIAPPGAVDGNLSFGQTFTISATLQKLGRAGVVDTAKVTLELLSGFTTAEPLEKVINTDNPAQWQVTAPNTAVNDSLTVRLTRRPFDENTNDFVAVPPSRRFSRVPVRTDSSGYLRILSWSIVSPSGASQGIVSTRQLFVVQAEVESRKAGGAEALLLPGNFNTTQDLIQNVKENGRTILRWVVQAPAASSFGRKDTLRIELTGTDKSSNQPILKQRRGIPVETVEQARLVLTGVITEPLSARQGGSVGLNALIKVMATVENLGQAKIRGNAKIKLTLPDDPSLPPAQDYRTTDDSVQTIDANGSFTWQIRARSLPSLGREIIRLRLLEPYPVDINTDSTAAISDNEVTIAIQTEPKRLTVQTLPTGQGPVVRGENSSLLMRLKLTNESNLNSSNILLRSLTWHVVNHNNQPLNASQVMKALRVVDTNNPTRVLASLLTIPAADSLRLPFAPADTLFGSAPKVVDVLVDIVDNAGEAFRLAFKRSADVDAIDQDSGERVEIIFKDENGSEVKADQVVSAKRFIAEADFQEAFFNYPNPFDPDEFTKDGVQGTKFNYFLSQASDIEFRIFTLLGELVYAQSFKSTDPEGRPASDYKTLVWNGRNGKGARVLNGVYLAMLKTSAGMATTKVAVLKK